MPITTVPHTVPNCANYSRTVSVCTLFVRFSNGGLTIVRFSNVGLTVVRFSNGGLTVVGFSNVGLTVVGFSNVDLTVVRFSNGDLTVVRFSNGGLTVTFADLNMFSRQSKKLKCLCFDEFFAANPGFTQIYKFSCKISLPNPSRNIPIDFGDESFDGAENGRKILNNSLLFTPQNAFPLYTFFHFVMQT